MEDFRKCVSFITGFIAFFTLIAFIAVDDHLSKWELVKTNLVYNNETSILSKSQTPQYYILLNKYGSGNSETDYIDLMNQDCITVRIQQPNKKFYNQAVFSKKTYYIFDNNGVTKPENFNGYIQYDEKAYTLEEFYENPPFEGDIDPLGPKSYRIWGWITLGLVAVCLIGLIPFEDFEFHLPRGPMIKKLEKEYKEFFDHLKMTFKAPQLRRIIINNDWVIRTNDASSETNTIDIRCNRDGISYNYKTKKFILHDSSDITWSFAFLKYKSKWPSIYSAIADYVLNSVEGKTTEEDEIYINI